MSEYFAKVVWTKSNDDDYIDNKYCRAHQWMFDGGMTIDASSSPHVVPTPYSIEAYVDPEEAFIASLSSCHMLFVLSISAIKKYVIESYVDEAVGTMEKDANGNISMTNVILRPKIVFSGEKTPTVEQLEKIHHQAHQQCFIANSVKTNVTTVIRV
ncbi:MAG: OsmC family protein [Granulosicoccus sp.]